MENQQPKKVFTLYLNANTGFPGLIDNANYANVSWNVDYDSLFNRENYNYKYCNMRFRMVSEINTTSEPNDQTMGVIVANFGQNYTGKNVAYCVLAPIDVKPVSNFTPGTPGTYTPQGIMIDVETMTHALGQQIDVPYGLRSLNIQLWKDAYGCAGDANNILVDSSSTQYYYIIFQFELYN